jgi:D-amino-acid oxidase
MINVPIYLQYLLDTAIQQGAQTIQTTLVRSTSLAGSLRYLSSTLKEADTPKVDAYINATGISAGRLVPDENVYPIRGQTTTVKGLAKRITCIDAAPSNPTPHSPNILYILPRPHSKTTILGGTKQVNNWTAEPNSQTTREILEAAKNWAPELLNEKGEFEVLSEQVGLRPGRQGGARVEIEELEKGEFVVCHAYGHAGAGYQNSIGSAKKVVRLLGEYLEEAKGGTEAKL